MATDTHGGSEEQRSTEKIREDIDRGEKKISDAVEQIGERIQQKMDWRKHVKNAPYVAVGIAAGLGYLASCLLITRTTPMERIMSNVAEDVRSSLEKMTGSTQGLGLLKVALVGTATKAAASWLKNQAS